MDCKLIFTILCLASVSTAFVDKVDIFSDIFSNGTNQPTETPNLSPVSTSSAAPKTPTSTPITSSTSTSAPITSSSSTSAPITSSTSTSAPITSSSSTSAPVTSSTSTSAPITSSSSTSAPITLGTSTAVPSTSTGVPTTTSSPVSTTVSPPVTSTAAPTPNKTEPAEWMVRDTKNITCVIVKAVISVTIAYPTVKNVTDTLVLVPVNNDINGTVVDGICGNDTQSISIPMSIGLLTMDFVQKSSKISVSSIVLNATGLPDLKVNASPVYQEVTPLFATPMKMSYKCSKVQAVNLTNADNNTATLTVSEVQLQAFRLDKTVNFSDAQDCASMDTPDLVPIAVGVSLGVMILVVLVAYLIGRRRSQSSGYVSM